MCLLMIARWLHRRDFGSCPTRIPRKRTPAKPYADTENSRRERSGRVNLLLIMAAAVGLLVDTTAVNTFARSNAIGAHILPQEARLNRYHRHVCLEHVL